MNQTAFSRSLTGADLSSHLGGVQGKGDIRVGFFWTQVKLRTKNPARNGHIENRLCIAKQPIGDRYTISHAQISEKEAAQRYPQEYALFTRYEDAPSIGTALSELPGVARSEIGLLELHSVRSVEELLALSSDQVAQIGMAASRVYKVAQAWQANKDENADILTAADVQAKAEEAIKAMEERLARLEQSNNRLQAENDVLRTASTAHPAQASTMTAAVQAVEPDVPDVSFESDDFMSGGDVVMGNDDLMDDLPDPMKD